MLFNSAIFLFAFLPVAYVVWGAYHGALLAAYRRYSRWWDAMPQLMQRALMFALVVVGWTLFRAPSFGVAMTLLERMVVPTAGVAFAGVGTLAVLLLVAGVLAHSGPNTFEMRHRWRPIAVAGWAAVLLASLVQIYGAESSPFLYFQF